MIRRPPRSTLFSLHDALPIYEEDGESEFAFGEIGAEGFAFGSLGAEEIDAIVVNLVSGAESEAELTQGDRKSTRLNSSHQIISYAVFCLKKKKLRTPRRVIEL